MHAVLASVGTDGDIYPFLALGAALRDRGHRATLVANESFRGRAEERGLGFRPLVSSGEMEDALRNPDFWHPLKAPWVASRWGARFIRRQFDLLLDLAGDGDAVLVANPGVLAARLVKEKLDRPMASLVLQPWMIRSVHAPPIMPGGLTLPRWAPRPLGRLYWRGVNAVGDLLVGRPLNRIRAALGLKPLRGLFDWWLSPQLVIGMFPEWYGPPQPDWPSQLRLAGFPLTEGPGDGLPGEALEFCRGGDPPVAITFGTGMMHASGLFRAALEACRALGARAIFLTRYGEQLPPSLPPSARRFAFLPFRDLFPRCAAVVHHGGVGTTSEALAAGTPQLILPIAYDQLDNATRVERLGAGGRLGARRRTGARIAEALVRLMTPESRARCRAAAARFAGPEPLGTAARWIEDLARAAFPVAQ